MLFRSELPSLSNVVAKRDFGWFALVCSGRNFRAYQMCDLRGFLHCVVQVGTSEPVKHIKMSHSSSLKPSFYSFERWRFGELSTEELIRFCSSSSSYLLWLLTSA